MLLHTIMPYEAIFAQGAAQQSGGGALPGAQAQTGAAASGETAVPGGVVQWARDAYGTHVSRLVSTDPRAYLNAAYAPGAPWKPKRR